MNEFERMKTVFDAAMKVIETSSEIIAGLRPVQNADKGIVKRNDVELPEVTPEAFAEMMRCDPTIMKLGKVHRMAIRRDIRPAAEAVWNVLHAMRADINGQRGNDLMDCFTDVLSDYFDELIASPRSVNPTTFLGRLSAEITARKIGVVIEKKDRRDLLILALILHNIVNNITREFSETDAESIIRHFADCLIEFADNLADALWIADEPYYEEDEDKGEDEEEDEEEDDDVNEDEDDNNKKYVSIFICF